MYMFSHNAHIRHVCRGMNGSRSHTPDPLSPETSGSPATAPQRGQGQGGASPTMQQRIKAIGVPTPLAISSPIRRYIIFSRILMKKINVCVYIYTYILIFLEREMCLLVIIYKHIYIRYEDNRSIKCLYFFY